MVLGLPMRMPSSSTRVLACRGAAQKHARLRADAAGRIDVQPRRSAQDVVEAKRAAPFDLVGADHGDGARRSGDRLLRAGGRHFDVADRLEVSGRGLLRLCARKLKKDGEQRAARQQGGATLGKRRHDFSCRPTDGSGAKTSDRPVSWLTTRLFPPSQKLGFQWPMEKGKSFTVAGAAAALNLRSHRIPMPWFYPERRLPFSARMNPGLPQEWNAKSRDKTRGCIFLDERLGAMLTSPCTGLCRIEDNGFCRGCGRRREEIGAWSGAGEDFRRQVWAQLPQRRAALGIRLFRKDWSASDLRHFVVASLRRGGVWSAGGGVEFTADASAVQVDGGAIRCISPRGALAFDLDDSVVAFATGEGDDETIILATPRSGTGPSGLRRLGPDRGAVRQQDRAGILYDLGFGRAGCAFCLRATDPGLIAQLDRLAGHDMRGILKEFENFGAAWRCPDPDRPNRSFWRRAALSPR